MVLFGHQLSGITLEMLVLHLYTQEGAEEKETPRDQLRHPIDQFRSHEQGSQSGSPGLCVVCVCGFMYLMSHKAYDKRQKRLKVMEERAKELDNGGVTLSDLGFKC